MITNKTISLNLNQIIMAVITVSVDRVTNLANSDVIGKSDPYVKLELKQDVSASDRAFSVYYIHIKSHISF
jgi:CRISPR/Cas system CMR-associated protein Cmr3 (group 5 of RAMP superfamily)